MIKGHKIERKIEINDFLDMTKSFNEQNIITTDHTFFRLNEKQRKIFKEKVIKEYILSEIPILVGIQFNGCYAVFYKYGKDTLKVLLDIQPTKTNIVTFYIIDNNQIPKI
jgi:hypothetical protein